MTVMEYLTLQTAMSLSIAGIIGALLGYLLKQWLSAKAILQVERKWSEEFRSVTRDMASLRADQVDIKQELEKAQAEAGVRLATVRKELAAADTMLAGLQVEFAAIALSEAAVKDWQLKLEAEAKKAIELEAVAAAKDLSIRNLEAELASAVKASVAKDLNLQTLTAEIAELTPLKGMLEEANKSLAQQTVRFKTQETSRNGELAALKSRIGELEPLTAKVKDWEARYASMLNEKDAAFAKVTAKVSALEPLKEKLAAATKENESLRAKVRAMEPAADLDLEK